MNAAGEIPHTTLPPTQRKAFGLSFLALTVFFLLFIAHSNPLFPQEWWHPTSTTNNLHSHTYFVVSYSNKHKEAEWVAYELFPERVTEEGVKRKGSFVECDKVKGATAHPDDYKGSGYDRGHLAPARDMSFSIIAMRESFYMCNIAPQLPSFNRGIWKKLESLVREWAHYSHLYIVTGPVLSSPLGTIGPSNVSVPSFFYKVVMKESTDGKSMIAFLIPHSPSYYSDLKKYVVPVNKVEEVTWIDFFPALPDSIEEKLEGKVDLAKWTFTLTSSGYENNESKSSTTSVRCKGITEKGERCKRYTRDPSGYCWQHKEQQNGVIPSDVGGKRGNTAVRCRAITQEGTQCKRYTKDSSGYCWQHKK